MNLVKINQKKGAMEMSVGTMVTIVLLMIVLVLGIFFIQKIFKSGGNALDQIDAKVQQEINSLFAEEGKKIVVYPREREITIEQGQMGGFGFSIENKDPDVGTFTYNVSAQEIASGCTLNLQQANNLIILGRSGTEQLASGSRLEEAIFVKFNIPETTPLCTIRYDIKINKGGIPYASSDIDLVIK